MRSVFGHQPFRLSVLLGSEQSALDALVSQRSSLVLGSTQQSYRIAWPTSHSWPSSMRVFSLNSVTSQVKNKKSRRSGAECHEVLARFVPLGVHAAVRFRLTTRITGRSTVHTTAAFWDRAARGSVYPRKMACRSAVGVSLSRPKAIDARIASVCRLAYGRRNAS